MRVGVITFPGSNCDHDCYHVAKHVLEADSDFLWYNERQNLDYLDCIIIPGGFSYGDYLRPGAIAKIAPIMEDVREFADKGKLVIGICNGFQILTEAGLLPGMLMRNESLKFICKYINLKVENTNTPFTSKYKGKNVISMPIAHADGNYYCDETTLEELKKNSQIVFRYSSNDGDTTADNNPNGSVENIAGVCNIKGNVLGMMPHPERNAESIFKSNDGLLLFESIKNWIENI